MELSKAQQQQQGELSLACLPTDVPTTSAAAARMSSRDLSYRRLEEIDCSFAIVD